MTSDMVRIFIPIMPISSPNPMFDPLLESNKWSDRNCEEITQAVTIKVTFASYLELWQNF